MAKKIRELLWKLREDTADEISELQQGEEDISTWLDEESELTAIYYAKDLATGVQEQELSNHGLSLKTH